MIFDEPRTLNYVLNAIQADKELFNDYITAADQDRFFRITTRKKRYGERTIHEPMGDALQNMYKNLYDKLVDYQSLLPEYVHGFVKNKSPLTNASNHLGQKYILNLDVSNFFENITTEDVRKAFVRLGATEEAAESLARFCTVNGKLPQGTHTSPDLANHAFHDTDKILEAYANKNGLTYTRYADDMTFSGAYRMKPSEIIAQIEKSGQFKIATQKVKLQKRGANQYVTGLTVFDDKRPRISKLYKRRLRLELYLIRKYGVESFIEHSGILGSEPPIGTAEYTTWAANRQELARQKINTLRGRVNYINSIEPELAQKMWRVLDTITD